MPVTDQHDGPDLLIFLLAVAPTNQRTLFVTAWIALIVLATAFTIIAAVKHRSVRRRATAAGVTLKRGRHA